ncbi:MAG: hypothetical protein U0324_21405 [Polyangiales bacterium]
MQSAVRFEVEVGDDRVVRLPGEVPTGRAEIIVLIPSAAPRAAAGVARIVGLLRTDRPAPDDDSKSPQ